MFLSYNYQTSQIHNDVIENFDSAYINQIVQLNYTFFKARIAPLIQHQNSSLNLSLQKTN